jgi:hypothetical protein
MPVAFRIRGQGGGDFRGLAGFAEGDGGAAEAAAGHARADHAALAADLAGDFDHDVEFGAGDLEVVAQRIMAGGHQRAEGFEIVAGQRGGGGDGAGDLAHHVAGAAVDRIAEFVPVGLDIGGGDIAP